MIWQTALAVASGIPIGLQLSTTGAGGALLATPLLVYIAGAPVQEAAAMSLVIVAASALLGIWEFGRAGLIKVNAVAAFSWTGVIGAWVGAYGHRWVRGEVLLLLFGFLILAARALMIRHSARPAHPAPEESCADRFPRTCWLKIAGLGLVVGTLNGFFGVGGGFMIVPALVLILGFPARLAVGTSLTIIAVVAIGGIAAHLRFGSLDPRLTSWVIVGSALGILLGARLGHWTSPKAVSRTAATITVGLAFWLIVSNAGKLL